MRNRFIVSILTIGFLLLSDRAKAEPTELKLWPQGAPHSKGTAEIDQPTITYYPAPEDKAVGTGIVICPGGGYAGLAMGHEGTEIAEWFNNLGISAFILKYRLGKNGYHHPVPMLDAQRAIRTVRAGAEQWHINPNRIGIIGFSAGGHLASTVATHFDEGDSNAADLIDKQSSRPDFLILGYPVIMFGSEFTHKGSQRNLLGEKPDPKLLESLSNEKQVTKTTPPTFLFHTTADAAVPPENSVMFYLACRKNGVPVEMHIYQDGKHGIDLARNIEGTKTWPERLADWLKVRGLLFKS
jgi:acetyl esterase/lipase